MLSETPPVASVCTCANLQLSKTELGICYVKMKMNSIVGEEKQWMLRRLSPSVRRIVLHDALGFPVARREASEPLWLCVHHQLHPQGVTHVVASAPENWGLVLPSTHCKQDDNCHCLSSLWKRELSSFESFAPPSPQINTLALRWPFIPTPKPTTESLFLD